MAYLELQYEDVQPLVPGESQAKVQIHIEDALARAMSLVPELSGEVTDAQASAAKAIIRRAVARTAEAGSGAVVTQSQSAGPLSHSQTVENKKAGQLFWANEVQELKALFTEDSPTKGKAFSIDMAVRREPLGVPVWWF